MTGAVLAPYEIVFHGFSTELAAVLEGFYRSPNCFIVKNIDVQTNVVFASVGEFVPSYLPSYSFAPGVPPPVLNPYEQMRRRYGDRYNRMPSMPVPAPAPNLAVPAAPTRKGPETVLDERPLKITMYVEAVRLIERAKPKAAR